MTQPEMIAQFYATAAGAGATLIGFLAVANSIIENKSNSKSTSLQESILAESAYIAFGNVFLLSFVGLEPFINIGYGAVILAIIGLISTWRVAKSGLFRLKKLNRARARISQTVLLVSMITYLVEFGVGLLAVLHIDKHEVLVVLLYTIVALMAVGLTRAWELLGIRKILGES